SGAGTPSRHTATAPTIQQAVVVPIVRPTRMIIHAEGRDRCHSRQRTGLPSSEGAGSLRASRPRRPSRGTFPPRPFAWTVAGRIGQTATQARRTEPADVTPKNPRWSHQPVELGAR